MKGDESIVITLMNDSEQAKFFMEAHDNERSCQMLIGPMFIGMYEVNHYKTNSCDDLMETTFHLFRVERHDLD